jgi:large subunit ribosomal protein L25
MLLFTEVCRVFLAPIFMVSNNISLSAEPREQLGRQAKGLREKGLLPAVVYGQKTENLALVLDFRDFEKLFSQAGEHSLIDLKIKGKKEGLPVLIHDIQRDVLTGKIIHVDFYRPNLEEKVKTSIPLKIEGESIAVRDLSGTLVKSMSELEVRALPMNLPHEIVVNIDSLKTLGSEIFVKDLKLPEGVEILKDPEEVIVLVAAPARVEEELEKPIEEKVEEVEGVVKEGEEKEKEEEKVEEKGEEVVKEEAEKKEKK